MISLAHLYLGLCHAEKERVTKPLERFAFCVISGV